MKPIGRPKDSILYAKTHKEIASELKTSRQRVAEIERRALNKVRDFILKQGSLLILLGCSGPAFTAEELFNEQGGDTSTFSGGIGQSSSGGEVQTRGGSEGIGVSAGFSFGGMAGISIQAGASGAAALAGGPAMGEGGHAGASGSSSQGGTGPRECLAFFQNLDCARVCTNSASDCQAVLNCYVTKNSLDDCKDFTSMGISLAESAERNCCK